MIYRKSTSETTSITKKVQISRIVEVVQGVSLTVAILDDQLELHTRNEFLRTSIEMKQEQVRSDLEGGSYVDGTKIG